MVFNRTHGLPDTEQELPCGGCIGCRKHRAAEWAMRIVHETRYHAENTFLTLTYDNDHLPDPPTIQKREVQLFIKKLRDSIKPKKIRYYACGEYGENNHPADPNNLGRPHYHIILFGHEFKDKQEHQKCRDYIIYKSPTLAKIWGKGFCTIGDVNFTTAGYTAKYAVKKKTGEMADDWYCHTNLDTGEFVQLEPEFALSSNRPGLGYKWLQEFQKDCAKGFITTQRGTKAPIPKYYRHVLEQIDEQRQNGPYGLKELGRQAQKTETHLKDGLRREESLLYNDKRHKGKLQ